MILASTFKGWGVSDQQQKHAISSSKLHDFND
jgi:hypothetical protein